MEDLIDIGVDVLNPVQTTARGMDPERLKAIAGDRLAFWGGIDCQAVLPSGSVLDVEREKRRMTRTLGAGGGYVLAPAHNIQPDVPPRNVCALFMGAAQPNRRS
jgi:uroporphyrinogen decarboxylase